MSNAANGSRLSFWTKLVYGTGDWGTAGYGTLRQIFYAIFLTDVVGLNPACLLSGSGRRNLGCDQRSTGGNAERPRPHALGAKTTIPVNLCHPIRFDFSPLVVCTSIRKPDCNGCVCYTRLRYFRHHGNAGRCTLCSAHSRIDPRL